MSEIDDVSGVDCEKCGKKTNAKHFLFVTHWPQVLILRLCLFYYFFYIFLNDSNLLFLDLSRFIPGSYYFRKDSSSVSIPSVLGMDEMREIRRNLTDEAKEVFDFPKCKYELTAVVNHSGSMAGGHYTWFNILFFNLVSLFLIFFFIHFQIFLFIVHLVLIVGNGIITAIVLFLQFLSHLLLLKLIFCSILYLLSYFNILLCIH